MLNISNLRKHSDVFYCFSAASNSEITRHQRQLFLAPLPQVQFSQEINWKSALGEGNACLTSKGHLGYCTSFRECYPYFKIPDLSIWESWVLGNYDSCSYFNEAGRQAYGVCCTNPVTPSPIISTSTTVAPNPATEKPNLSNKIPYPGNIYPQFPFGNNQQWPPPLITHPPDHTAATHPPSHTTSGSTTTTTTSKPTTTWPTKSTTWSHVQQTKPTTTATTETPLPNFPGVCGVKNGRNSPVSMNEKF